MILEIDAVVLAADDPVQRVDQLRRLIQTNRQIAILASPSAQPFDARSVQSWR